MECEARMQKIGVLFGMENVFPGALVERINAMGVAGVTAEFVQIGAPRMEGDCPYRVVVDRISHDVPFYRAWLKTAALGGAYVVLVFLSSMVTVLLGVLLLD